MTGPLPPLPDSHPIDQIATVKVTLTSQYVYTEPQMQDYAKLAVREALERALSSVILRGRRDPSDVIRAMLEDYK